MEGRFAPSPQGRPAAGPVEVGLIGLTLSPPSLQVRVPPVYPSSELRRGVSGDCTVQSDVLASGQAANVTVLGGASTGFARASVTAVEQWCYGSYPGLAPHQVVQRSLKTTPVFNMEG